MKKFLETLWSASLIGLVIVLVAVFVKLVQWTNKEVEYPKQNLFIPTYKTIPVSDKTKWPEYKDGKG